MEQEIDPHYEQKRRELSRKGKLALFIGAGVALFGAFTFAMFFFTALFGHSLFGSNIERQGILALGFAAFLYFLGIVLMIAGGLVALGGLGVLLFANTGRMMKYQAAATLPVARAVVREVGAIQAEMNRSAPPGPAPPRGTLPAGSAPTTPPNPHERRGA